MKVWNREIFGLLALAKFNSRENVLLFRHESFFLRKIFFSPTANYKVFFIGTSLIKLISLSLYSLNRP